MTRRDDDWGGTRLEGYQVMRPATEAEYNAAAYLASNRASAASAAAAAAKRATFEEWAAALDAQLGTAEATPELKAARKALAAAEDTLAKVAAALESQRAEMVKQERAAAEPLTSAPLERLMQTAKQVGTRSQDLDAQRAIVAELERRHAAAVEARNTAADAVGTWLTVRYAEHAERTVEQIRALWSPLWAAFEELQRTERLIMERGGQFGARWTPRLGERHFNALNQQLKAKEA